MMITIHRRGPLGETLIEHSLAHEIPPRSLALAGHPYPWDRGGRFQPEEHLKSCLLLYLESTESRQDSRGLPRPFQPIAPVIGVR